MKESELPIRVPRGTISSKSVHLYTHAFRSSITLYLVFLYTADVELSLFMQPA